MCLNFWFTSWCIFRILARPADNWNTVKRLCTVQLECWCAAKDLKTHVPIVKMSYSNELDLRRSDILKWTIKIEKKKNPKKPTRRSCCCLLPLWAERGVTNGIFWVMIECDNKTEDYNQVHATHSYSVVLAQQCSIWRTCCTRKEWKHVY